MHSLTITCLGILNLDQSSPASRTCAMTDPFSFHPMQRQTRRSFLGKSSTGIGLAALAGLLEQDQLLGAGPSGHPFPVPFGRPRPNAGSRSVARRRPLPHRSTDPKPKLTEMAGKDIPRILHLCGHPDSPPCLPITKPGPASRDQTFETYGQCGTEMSSMFRLQLRGKAGR